MVHEINIAIHVIAGTLGLGIGIIPFITKKGGQKHRLFGKIFLCLISISIITAFNGVLFFRDRPFLTVITLLSLYQSISGYRAIKYKQQGPNWIDLILVLTMLIFCFSFIYKLQQSNIVWPKTVVYYTLGYLLFFLSYDLLRLLKVINNKKLWLIEHIVKMTGAYSALFTAAAGTVLAFWEPYNQIISALLGTMLLIAVTVLYLLKWKFIFHK